MILPFHRGGAEAWNVPSSREDCFLFLTSARADVLALLHVYGLIVSRHLPSAEPVYDMLTPHRQHACWSPMTVMLSLSLICNWSLSIFLSFPGPVLGIHPSKLQWWEHVTFRTIRCEKHVYLPSDFTVYVSCTHLQKCYRNKCVSTSAWPASRVWMERKRSSNLNESR